FLAGSGSYSKEQIELFGEVFKILVAAIELKARETLARTIATDPNMPAALMRAFAFDEEIAVAGPVLRKSPALSEADLVASARSQAQGHLYAIAQRQVLTEAVTDILIQRGENKVVYAVVENAGARISDLGFRELVARSDKDCELAVRVGARRDIPRHHFLKLLEIASAAACSKIVAAHQQLAEAARQATTDVVDQINQAVRDTCAAHARARTKVRRRKYWRELSEADVQGAARGDDFERVVLALSVLARCPIEVAERAVLNESPGAVQIVAKAAGCSWPTVKALLLMRTAGRMMSTTDLDRACENYDRLELRTAQRVLRLYKMRRNMAGNTNRSTGSSESQPLDRPDDIESAA
ncbi:MAG TPA: DUF2336 domain-containing protein, partial [Gemmataceae bacterium]|nr:DUF2336 domain-containing protein [Gemmataceae bacterium]